MVIESENGQGGLITPSQEMGSDPFAVFNEAIPLVDEDSGLIEPSIFENQTNEPAPAEQQAPANPSAQGQQAPTNPINPAVPGSENQNQTAEENRLSFNDELVDKFSGNKDDFDVDEALNKLKEKGYEVAKKSDVPEDQAEKVEYERLQSEYSNATAFLQKSNDEIIQNKVRDEIAREYAATGKSHLIGTEEFTIDVSEKVERINENDLTKKLYVDNVKNQIQAYANGVKDKISQADVKVEQKRKQSIAQERVKLQGEIQTIVTDKFFGIEISNDEAVEIYNEITSGEFAREVNSNPKLVAEFALFKKHRETIGQSLVGATYGEGVKAAVDQINRGQVPATKSPLQQAMSSSSNAQNTVANRRSLWQTPVEENVKQEPAAKQKVVGQGFI